MNINITHVAVYVKDLEKSRQFYEQFFNGRSNDLYRNPSGFSSYFITFDGGATLELMHHEELEVRHVIDRATGWNHIAFSLGSRDAVLELTNRIVNTGHRLYSAPRETGDGYYESCVADPDGNRVELTV